MDSHHFYKNFNIISLLYEPLLFLLTLSTVTIEKVLESERHDEKFPRIQTATFLRNYNINTHSLNFHERKTVHWLT